MITVDSRGCGAGKTQQIFKNIQLHQQLNQRVLVALPSIHLVEQYQNHFADNQISACIITSKTSDNVQRDLYTALCVDHEPLIVCTQAALSEAHILSGVAGTRHLIWDEAFEPWKEIEIRQSEDDVIFDWTRHTTSTTDLDLEDYVRVDFNKLLTNSIMDTHPVVRDLCNVNYINWMSCADYGKMVSSGAKRVVVIQELRAEFFTAWASVHIAAAAFEKTYLRWWMQRWNIDYCITQEFEPHTIPVTVHYPDSGTGGWNWSKNKKTTHNWLWDEFQQYVHQQTRNKDVLRLKNKKDKTAEYDLELLVPHNAAGINGMSHYEHVSLESALNPTAEFGAWLRLMTEFATPIIPRAEADAAIFAGRTGYTFYQVLMRCSLRDKDNPRSADIYMIDQRGVVDLADYFKTVNLREFVPQMPPPKPTKQPPLTQAERQQINRAKKKDPERFKGLKGRTALEELLRNT